MAKLTILIGVLLIAVGLTGYYATGGVSVTALIPAFIGLVVAALGAIALKEGARKHALHAALAVALLGFLGTASALLKLPALVAGGEVERPAAVVSRVVTALLCALLIGLGVRSFVAARRGRAA